jgi:alkylation response protein AidB-like acyl-CoA dehydrogenase
VAAGQQHPGGDRLNPSTEDPVGRARAIADEMLLPSAITVDRTQRIPPAHLDRLAAAGLYGLAARPDPPIGAVAETLATGCLATTFVWLQHHGAVRAVMASPDSAVRERWLDALCTGERRAGVVQAALRPGPASVRARRVDGGYVFDGEAPWVTGWGMVDTLFTAARLSDLDGGPDTVVWALLDADDTLAPVPQRLIAVNASATVSVRFAGHAVPAERVLFTAPYTGPSPDPGALRVNGALALGVAGRCLTLLGDTAPATFADELNRCREALNTGADVASARAAAAEFALRCAATLVVTDGSRAILDDADGQRLLREAGFLLVFGTRAPIRAALLKRLAGEA